MPLSGLSTEKVVDIGIQCTLDALLERDADVLVSSHGRDILDQVGRLVESGHRVGIVGFPELVGGAYADLDVELYDLEADVGAFNSPLPRVRIIPIADFDPAVFLR